MYKILLTYNHLRLDIDENRNYIPVPIYKFFENKLDCEKYIAKHLKAYEDSDLFYSDIRTYIIVIVGGEDMSTQLTMRLDDNAIESLKEIKKNTGDSYNSLIKDFVWAYKLIEEYKKTLSGKDLFEVYEKLNIKEEK